MGQVLLSATPIGDVVIDEYSAAFCRETKRVTNASEVDIALVAGYPMDDNVPVEAGDEANVDGILMTPVTVPAGEWRDVAVLARGPAVINQDKLPTLDYAGESFSALAAAIVAGIQHVIARSEPITQYEQTT